MRNVNRTSHTMQIIQTTSVPVVKSLYFTDTTNQIMYQMFKLKKKIWELFEFYGSKKLGRCHVYHCVTSPLLTTVHKNLTSEETNCCTFVGEMLSHSCRCHVFFSWCSKCFQLVRGLDCRQASSVFSTAKPCCCNTRRMLFSILLLKYAKLSLKDILSFRAYVALKPLPFIVNFTNS